MPLAIRNDQMQTMATSSPDTKMVQPCPLSATWIEIKLVDPDGAPVAGARYHIQLPDSSVWEGEFDESGTVRVDGIVPGQATVTFPDLDAREWKKL